MNDIRSASLDRLTFRGDLDFGPVLRPQPLMAVLRSRAARVVAVAAAATGLLVTLAIGAPSDIASGPPAPAKPSSHEPASSMRGTQLPLA